MPDIPDPPSGPLTEIDIAKTLFRMDQGIAGLRVDFHSRLDQTDGRIDSLATEVDGIKRHVFGSRQPGARIPSRDDVLAVRTPISNAITSSALTIKRAPYATSPSETRKARLPPSIPREEEGPSGGTEENDPADTPKARTLVDEIARAKQLADAADRAASQENLRGDAHEGRLIAIEQQLEEAKARDEDKKRRDEELLALQKKQMKVQGVALPPDPDANPDEVKTFMTRLARGTASFAEFIASREGAKFIMHLVTAGTALYIAGYAAFHGAPPVPWGPQVSVSVQTPQPLPSASSASSASKP